MMMPAFAGYVYLEQQESNSSVLESLKKTGVTWLKTLAVGSAMLCASLGVFHIVGGIYDVSPNLCPRE